MNVAATYFFRCPRIIQHCKHRIDSEYRVFRAPGLWFGFEQKIFKWAGTQRIAPSIHAISVSLQYLLFSVRCRCHNDLCPGSKTVKSKSLVHVERRGSNDFGQLTRRLAADQVHLKKAILAMSKTGRKSKVRATACRDDRNTGRIPLNSRNICQPGRRKFAIQLGQACAEGEPGTQADEKQE